MIDLNLKSLKFDGKTLLQDLNISLKAGESLIIEGPNGSGKSSLLKLLCGIIPHAQQAEIDAELWVDGQNLSNSNQASRFPKIAYGFAQCEQQFVCSNLFMELKLLKMRSALDLNLLDRLLHDLDLHSILEKNIHECSSGERQRAALALVLLQDSTIKLFDEPLSHLDSKYREKFEGALSQVAKNSGQTIVVAESQKNAFGRFTFNQTLSLGHPQTADLTALAPANPRGDEIALEASSLVLPYTGRSVPDFSLKKGEAVHLSGPNGCGKTSLFRSLMGFESFPEGQVHRFSSQMAYVPEAVLNGFSQFSLEAEAKAHGVDDETLEALGLHKELDRFPLDLSAGEQKRLALAMSLAKKADVYLLDEVFENVDAAGKTRMLNLLATHQNRGATILFTGHNMEWTQNWRNACIQWA